MKEKEKLKYNVWLILASLIILEFIFAGLLSLPFFNNLVSGGVGENVTVSTTLEVGAVYPEILNISLNYDSDITLTANSTKRVDCAALVRDYNNDTDITYAEAILFNSTYGAADDNNTHYSNYSCNLSYVYSNPPLSWQADDNYTAIVNCTFQVEFYANPGDWNCTILINDTTDRNDSDSDNGNISELLAIGMDDTLNYGIVNSTDVSDEKITNVTNVGNIPLNLSLSGYAVTESDGYAMNCTLGDINVFNINYEKYNLTTTTPGQLSLTEFENNYINLTSSPVLNQYDLGQRQNDAVNEATNQTFWRIYVPRGVAGTCSGNIVFGASKAAA